MAVAAALVATGSCFGQAAGGPARGPGDNDPPPIAPPVAARGGAATAPVASGFQFFFGPGKAPEGYTQVAPDAAYTAGKWGFDGSARPELVEAGDDPRTGRFGRGPFTFSTDIAEGNYRVTAHLGDPKGESTTTILAESRRLMVPLVHTQAGKTTTVSFIVNVRNTRIPPPPANAPGGSEVRVNRLDNALTWDDRLTLTFTNSRPCVSAIEIEPVTVPTIFIMGDSTVTDQGADPGASWGQMLPAFFKPEVAIANHATSGETMKSSITGLRLEKVLSQIKKGDVLLMQFGHNDEKQSWPQTYVEPETTFKAYARVFIAEAKRKGATPVLISMMERRGNTGPAANSHGGFPKAYQELAKSEEIAFIDNWTRSKILYEAMGPDVAAAFNDATHHRNYGAYEIAKLVATGLRANQVEIAKYLKDDFKDFDPAHPDKFAEFTIPMK
jgi:lysophospholipase L1-like esterase